MERAEISSRRGGRYHPLALDRSLRFVALALPLALLVLVLGGWLVSAIGFAPDTGPLAARGVARPDGVPFRVEAAAGVLEAAGLVALTLLLAGRTSRWWLDGLACGLVAWIFRGPLLVLAVGSLTRLPTGPFADLARGALLLDVAAALAVAALARLTIVEAA
jgi:hypothetical protein